MKTIALLVIICTGCVSVPATRVSFNPTTHEVVIRSPKDVELSNVAVKVQGDAATITIEHYSSKNNSEVITAIAAQNAATAKAIAEVAGTAIGAAAAKMK